MLWRATSTLHQFHCGKAQVATALVYTLGGVRTGNGQNKLTRYKIVKTLFILMKRGKLMWEHG